MKQSLLQLICHHSDDKNRTEPEKRVPYRNLALREINLKLLVSLDMYIYICIQLTLSWLQGLGYVPLHMYRCGDIYIYIYIYYVRIYKYIERWRQKERERETRLDYRLYD